MADARRHYNNDGMDPDWKPADRPSPSATSNEEPNLVGLADRVEYWVDPARCEYELAEGGQVPRIRLELRLRGSEWAKVIKALRSLDSENTFSKDAVIEEIAAEIEKSPLTYTGPDPQSIRALHTLMVRAIRDMKGVKQ